MLTGVLSKDIVYYAVFGILFFVFILQIVRAIRSRGKQ